MRSIKTISIIVLFVVFFAGCAYTTKSTLSENIKTIDVSVFGNSTYYNNIEGLLTQEIIKAINLSPRLKVVNKNADAVLSGSIFKVTNVVIEYDSNNNAKRMTTTMSAKFSLYDNSEGYFIIDNRTVNSAADSSTTGRFDVAKHEHYSDAQRKSIVELAKVIVRSMVDNW